MEFSICWLTILYYIIVYQVDFKLVFGLEFPLGNPNPRFHLVGDARRSLQSVGLLGQIGQPTD